MAIVGAGPAGLSAAWYLRQIQGSANLEGSRFLHVMSGHLSHQIEHHLFPDLPAHRYAEIAAEVRVLCEDPCFDAVGRYYDVFDQTTDEEVLELLRAARGGGAYHA